MAAATATADGYLTSADWSTFNGKTSNTGTTTAGNTQTFTNKSGSNDQWTNDAGYTTNTGTVTGAGAAGRVSFWDSTSSLDDASTLYWDSTNNHLGINDSSPGSPLKVYSGTNEASLYTIDVNHVKNNANVSSHAIRLNVDLSGADTTTADRINSGLYIDMDSSANGDASHEHRMYGVYSDVKNSGFSDLVRGGYFYAESNYTGAKTSSLAGVHGIATHDTNNVAGGVSNMYGGLFSSNPQDIGDVDNATGVMGAVVIGTARGNADIGNTNGVIGKITIDKAVDINYSTMIGVSSIIDNNEGTVPTFGNQYLFKGDYQGTKGSLAWGIYVEGDKNYLEGNLGINTTVATQKLHVNGNARVTGAYYDANNSPGTAGQILSSTATGTDWIDAAAGDITGVTAGTGMTGGGTSGAVTLNVIGGTGITANADDIAIDSTVATLTGTQTFTNKSGSNSQWTNDEGYTDLVVGTAATEAMAGDTTTITSAQATAISNNTAKVSDTGVPAVLSNGSVPSLNTNISQGEMRALIGAGTSSLVIGTTADRAMAGNITTITTAQSSAITANTAKVSSSWTAAGNDIYNNNSANVGVGVVAPTEKLHVAGNARVTGKYHDSNDNPGLEGQVLKTKVVEGTTTGTDWEFVTWTPDIWQVNPTTSALTAATTLVCDTVPVYEGTTQTSGGGAGAGEIRILDAGLYEINYSVAINVTDTNVSTRQVVALYLTAHPLNGSEIKIPGSLNSTYLRLPGTNQGGGTSFSNTVYYGVPINTDIALKIDWIDGNTKSVNIVEPFSIQNTISIRRIGDFEEPE
jgi:hypothetical protein